MKKSVFGWLVVLGIGIRLVVMPITAHPDFWALFFSGNLLPSLGVVNVYNYLALLPPEADLAANYGTNYFTYPPLAYFTFGVFAWAQRLVSAPGLNEDILHRYPQVYGEVGTMLAIFWFKLPYLIIDLAIAYVLSLVVKTQEEKRRIVVLWLLNPIAIYASFMMGQFDVIPTFFTVLAVYLAVKKRLVWSMLALGVGAAYKMYPLLLVPLWVVYYGDTIKEKIKLFVAGIAPYWITILPFIGYPAFQKYCLFSGQSQKMLAMRWNVYGQQEIIVFVVGYFLILFAVGKWREKMTIWQLTLMFFLVYFGVTDFHPQWLVWVAPFFLLNLVNQKAKFGYSWGLVIVGWLLITLTYEASLNFGIFIPISPALVEAQNLGYYIKPYFDPLVFRHLVRSLLVAVFVRTGWLMLKGSGSS